MLRDIEASPLYPIVNPRSIAFFGASNRFSAMGTHQLSSLKSLGFEGNIYPIHPREKRVLDLPAYRSVQDLPEVPDLAVMVLPTGVVPQVMDECGRIGIKHAVVVSGGFSEVGGEGIELQKKLLAIAEKFGIRFLGPNCLGVANPHHKFNMTFLPFEGRPGFIGLASQSGSLITQMFGYLDRFGLGFSTGISVGNEASIDIVEGMEYLAACPNTRVIALYIESIRRGRDFIEIARSIVPSKPIVAFYAGGSEAGKRASLSHTGALAGPDALYDGVFRQAGVIRAASIPELFDFCSVLPLNLRPATSGVVILTNSGGPGAAAADACSRNGLELPQFSESTVAKLSQLVPHTGSISNPVDLTFSKNPMEYFNEVPDVLLAETAADSLMIYILTPGQVVRRAMESMDIPADQIPRLTEKLSSDQASFLTTLIDRHRKPVIGFTFQSYRNPSVQKLIENEIPILPSPERAARALWALVTYAGIQRRIEP
jgi:acyl-CoA synthetase (NDP forming)